MTVATVKPADLLAEAPILTLTDAAAEKVSELLAEEGNPNLNLRMFIVGGGCSGLKYEFEFDENINDDDTVIKKSLAHNADQGVQILVDSISLQYLQGITVDYKNDINGEQFVISNPNAKTTCGCGSSFTPQEEPEVSD